MTLKIPKLDVTSPLQPLLVPSGHRKKVSSDIQRNIIGGDIST